MTLSGSETSSPVSQSSARAFPAVPRVELYFPGASVEECRTRILRCVLRGDGPAVVVGAPGMGKSMLLAAVAQSLADQLEVVQVASTQLCTRRALLQAILFSLGMPYQNREEGELRLALISRLEDAVASPKPAVLLIDEAQALPIRLLEELRILSNLQRNGESLLRIVLAGSAVLEEQFASTELEAFNQRLAARCYLAPLDYGETHQYVQAHVAAAGADPQLFSGDALDMVYSASDGVPRLINQVCDRAILMAVENQATTVDRALIQSAWSDLHQLPAPWHNPDTTVAAPETDVVEFGVLPGSDQDAEAVHELTAGELSVQQAVDDQPPGLPVVGSWNADHALETLFTAEPPSEVANDAPVSDISPQLVSAKPAEEPAGDPEAESEPEVTPDASTLFGDGFEEEEIVLDRFATLDRVISPTAPVVTNTQDADFGRLVGELGVGEAAVAEVPTAVEAAEPEQAVSHENEQAEQADVLPLCGSYATLEEDPAVDIQDGASCATGHSESGPEEQSSTDSDVLIIETDPARVTTQATSVHRQEYRQLFSSLRQGHSGS